jgi:hypothetical protein
MHHHHVSMLHWNFQDGLEMTLGILLHNTIESLLVLLGPKLHDGRRSKRQGRNGGTQLLLAIVVELQSRRVSKVTANRGSAGYSL